MQSEELVLKSILKEFFSLGRRSIHLAQFSLALKTGKIRRNNTKFKIDYYPKGAYLISTNKGVFHLNSNILEKILPFNTFGISVENGRLYASISISMWSYVISLKISEDKETIRLSDLKLLFKENTKYHNERLHQIHASHGTIAIANTKRNSITLIESLSGKVIIHLYPFQDSTGFPIHKDHNHLNSVFQTKNMIFFTAHNGGAMGSLIGFINKNKVHYSIYKYRGVHDVIPSSRGLIFSDTFGSLKDDLDDGGRVIIGGKDQLKFNSLKKRYMIRGIAETGNEVIVGSSFHSKRELRYKNNCGSILVFEDDNLKFSFDIPASQVCDIIRLDGLKSDEIPELTEKAALSYLKQAVGSVPFTQKFYASMEVKSNFFIYESIPNVFNSLDLK